MGKDYTKQHIVPVCYLANFGINGNEGRKSKIYFYLKDKHVSECGNVEKYPIENGFYDIPELDKNKKILELFFQRTESQLSDLLKTLISTVVYEKRNRISGRVDLEPLIRTELSGQFALLIQRTNMQRKQIKSIYEQLHEGLPFKAIPAYDKDDFKRLHNTQLLDLKLANFYANMFEDKKWAVLVNHTDLPFWTSDNPVIAINHSTQGHVAAASDDLTYYIPISPLFAIEMYPKSVNWSDLTYFDLYDTHNIASYNSYIEEQSTRMIFSNKGFAERM